MTENIDVNTLLEGLGGWGKWQVGSFLCFHRKKTQEIKTIRNWFQDISLHDTRKRNS